MKRKNKKFTKRSQNPLNKLSLFQKADGRFKKKCPLSVKDAPEIDYKNVKLLKRYLSDTDKILPSSDGKSLIPFSWLQKSLRHQLEGS